MAKDELERVEKDEDLPFEIPKFDEDEFVRKELISFRTTVVLFVFSLLTALLTFSFWKGFGWDAPGLSGTNRGQYFFILLVMAMAFGFFLPFVYRLTKIDISHFKRKEWIGTAFLHFFFWMGFTLLLTNPPFSDAAAPVIDARASPAVQGVGFNVSFAAYVADNKDLDEGSLRFCLLKSDEPPLHFADLSDTQRTACAVQWTRPDSKVSIWTYHWRPDAEGTYAYYVTAGDAGGKTSEHRGLLRVGSPFLTIDPPTGSSFSRLTDLLVVKPDPSLDLRSVLYTMEGRSYNMSRPTHQGALGEYWTTNPTFPGWKAGAVNMTLAALEQPSYLHTHKLEGERGQDAGATRSYNVDPNFPEIGTAKEANEKERAPPAARRQPGFETVALLGAVVAAVLLVADRTRRHG